MSKNPFADFAKKFTGKGAKKQIRREQGEEVDENEDELTPLEKKYKKINEKLKKAAAEKKSRQGF